MNRINLLNNETSNKIAAGEVVERPASVVKELLENSIDASASNITIEILEGGKKQIKIIDDGYGIHPDDIEKAFLPHSTSKISEIEDIYSIQTFGFRGEALASISSVSNVILRSRHKDMDFGKEISISGNNINYVKEVGCNTGTYIEVNDLFFNVPARKKFLKSTQREASLISNIANKLALANYEISFKYYNNNKKSFITFPSSDVKDAIRVIHGKQIYENILPFEAHSDIVSIYGYIGNKEISRGSRNNQSIFVNKRYIKSPLITTAVENAFKSFLTINKHPFFVLFLDIYPEFIDVNVHPAKSEVKFHNEQMIYKVVFDTVHTAIGENVKDSFNIPLDELEEDILDKKLSFEETALSTLKNNVNNSNILNDKDTNTNTPQNNVTSNDSYTKTNDHDDNNNKTIVQLPIDLKSDDHNTPLETKVNLEHKSYIDEKPKVEFKKEGTIESSIKNKATIEPKFPPLKIIGQFNNTYILGEACGEFYMIDQHAAHEKILYEKFRKQIGENSVVSQVLILPTVLELSFEDFTYYKENEILFKETGFSIEPFGDNTINIKEAPILLGKIDVKNFFLEILDNIKNMGSGKIEDVKAHAIATLSCKAAIKANHALTSAEMIALVETLRYLNEPFNCPHGRPTIIKTSLKDIEKKFKRIQ